MQTFRQWWRRTRSELRYRVEEKMVWRVLRLHPERCFVRIVFMIRGDVRPPVIGPANSGEEVTTALIQTMKAGRAHFHDTTDLMPLERRLDNVFMKTNFVDMRVGFQDGMLGVRIMPQPRITAPPLPPLPDWDDPNWPEWDMVDR